MLLSAASLASGPESASVGAPGGARFAADLAKVSCAVVAELSPSASHMLAHALAK